MAKRKKKGNPIIFGLIILGAAIGVLWQNEHRFNYYKAAEKTVPVEEIGGLAPDTLFSHTEAMDQSLTLKGYYVDAFEGYLEVHRRAEIYAWDRDEDDDGVTWTKKWMSSLEQNNRNKDLRKDLRSDHIRPDAYEVGELKVHVKKLQFVDSNTPIAPSTLQLTEQGAKKEFELVDEYFYLSKGGQLKDAALGDERLSYRGLPVPETATYFGKWGGKSAIAYQAEVKEGFIAAIIGDKGILHHLVAGSRDTALLSIKAHLKRLKMIVRAIGLAFAAIGGGVFFSSLTRFLIFIPVVGVFINRISGWLGMLIGFLLGLITLVLAFLTSQPLALGLFFIVLASAFFFLWKNARQKRSRIQRHLSKSLGHSPSQHELGELEYVKLYQLLSSDGEITALEQKQLDQCTKKHSWSAEHVASLTQRAKEAHPDGNPQQNLESLIHFTLADGEISRTEMKTLEQAATKIGVSRLDLSSLIMRAQSA